MFLEGEVVEVFLDIFFRWEFFDFDPDSLVVVVFLSEDCFYHFCNFLGVVVVEGDSFVVFGACDSYRVGFHFSSLFRTWFCCTGILFGGCGPELCSVEALEQSLDASLGQALGGSGEFELLVGQLGEAGVVLVYLDEIVQVFLGHVAGDDLGGGLGADLPDCLQDFLQGRERVVVFVQLVPERRE